MGIEKVLPLETKQTTELLEQARNLTEQKKRWTALMAVLNLSDRKIWVIFNGAIADEVSLYTNILPNKLMVDITDTVHKATRPNFKETRTYFTTPLENIRRMLNLMCHNNYRFAVTIATPVAHHQTLFTISQEEDIDELIQQTNATSKPDRLFNKFPIHLQYVPWTSSADERSYVINRTHPKWELDKIYSCPIPDEAPELRRAYLARKEEYIQRRNFRKEGRRPAKNGEPTGTSRPDFKPTNARKK